MFRGSGVPSGHSPSVDFRNHATSHVGTAAPGCPATQVYRAAGYRTWRGKGQVAQASDLAGISNTVGAPFLAVFARSGAFDVQSSRTVIRTR
jgi:hypothetical protein